MSFVPLALFKDTIHFCTAGCRETMWRKRLFLRKRRPPDQNQDALTSPQLEQPPFHLRTQKVVFQKKQGRE